MKYLIILLFSLKLYPSTGQFVRNDSICYLNPVIEKVLVVNVIPHFVSTWNYSKKIGNDSNCGFCTTDRTNIVSNIVSIYPNPAQDIINVELNGIGRSTLKIVNLNGVEVYSASVSNSDHISTANITSGVYILQVINGENITTHQIIIE